MAAAAESAATAAITDRSSPAADATENRKRTLNWHFRILSRKRKQSPPTIGGYFHLGNVAIRQKLGDGPGVNPLVWN